MDLELDCLHIGDNLFILQQYVPEASVDLVYLDPPFKKSRAYHLIFRDESGRTSDAQQVAFDDSWHWGPTADSHYLSLAVPGPGSHVPPRLSTLIVGLLDALTPTELTAYLVEMAVRLVELHRVLKPTGSIYLHCDPTASHYLKLIMDAIFGPENFRNEIVWKRHHSGHGDAKMQFGRIHDVILFYSRSRQAFFRTPRWALTDDQIAKKFPHRDPDGRRWYSQTLTSPNPNRPNLTYEWSGHSRVWKVLPAKMQELHDAGEIHYSRTGFPRRKQYADRSLGPAPQDIWADVQPLTTNTKERRGYPTQKPIALLRRIIEASSQEGEVVLDPFAGCGTAMEAAVEAKRRWIGIDLSDQARRVINERSLEVYHTPVKVGRIVPKDLATARLLAKTGTRVGKDFEMWAVNEVGGRPNPNRDRGIDGFIPFVNRRGKIDRALISVKSGGVHPRDVRELRGTVSRERAAVGVFITLRPPSREMQLEADRSRLYAGEYPKLQILTVEEILAGARPKLPPFRQQELPLRVAEADAAETTADLVADLEERIEEARRARRRSEQAQLENAVEQIKGSIREAMAAVGEPDEPEGVELRQAVDRRLAESRR